MRCPIWPQVAEEWPKRRRYSGWPNSATISKVVHEGCDVVQVTHRDMHEDLYQRRLSFSRAEVTLIQSWTPTQQIVYHLLRFFAKREIIRKNCPKREEVVCTYHLKTLMLWSCEEESTEWWETSSVIAICCKLCGKLCECLKHKHCPNYFIPEANLLDYELNSEILQQAIKTLDHFNDVDKMSQWFMTHYILPIYQELCNEDETVLTEEKVERCTISVCEYNERNQLNDLDDAIFMCVLRVFTALDFSYSLYWRDTYAFKTAYGEEPMKMFIDTTAVSKAHDTLADYMKALILFQMSQYMLSSKFQCDVELLSEIWIHIIRQSYFVESPNSMKPLSVFDRSMLYFNRAEQIMKHLVFGYSKNESCLAKMVSILCLQKSLCCHDSSSCQTETASRLYLAALFYYIGHLQCTVQLCSQVATSFKENDHCREVRNLKVNSLLFMDDLATIAGFLLLRRNILRIPNKSIFLLSTELFVHYLFIQCSPERLEMKEKSRMALQFEADCCLEAMMRYKILRRFDSKIQKNLIYSRCTEDAEKSTTDIVLPGKTDIAESLVRISNDYMTRFYDSLSEEFGSKFNLASSYEALSLYLCRRYEDVLGLCEKLLEQPEHDSELEEFQYLNVHVGLLFIEYFDEDIQTLVGFQLLVLHLSSMQDVDFENILDDDMKWMTRLQFFDRYSKFLFPYMTYYEIFKPTFRRQFLGNYLKLRCLMDLGFPLFEVKSAFRCLESRFLFEHILLHFMREKIIRCYRATTTKRDVNRF